MKTSVWSLGKDDMKIYSEKPAVTQKPKIQETWPRTEGERGGGERWALRRRNHLHAHGKATLEKKWELMTEPGHLRKRKPPAWGHAFAQMEIRMVAEQDWELLLCKITTSLKYKSCAIKFTLKVHNLVVVSAFTQLYNQSTIITPNTNSTSTQTPAFLLPLCASKHLTTSCARAFACPGHWRKWVHTTHGLFPFLYCFQTQDSEVPCPGEKGSQQR